MKKIGFVLLLFAVVLVVTGIPSYAEEINACKDKKGEIRIVDDPIECTDKEVAIILSQKGDTGPAGVDGLNCWDLNGDRICDVLTEDTNDDGFCSVLDCRLAEECVPIDEECGCNIPYVDHEVFPASPVVGELIEILFSDQDLDNSPLFCDLGQIITVKSEFIELPPGSTVTTLTPFVGHDQAFTADVAGDYGIKSTITDDTGLSSIYFFEVTVSP